MGIYLLIIASADIFFGDSFPMNAERWRSGITCRITGAISMLSSEASDTLQEPAFSSAILFR